MGWSRPRRRLKDRARCRRRRSAPATSDIRAVEFTPSREGDSPVLPDLLDQIPQGEEIGTVTAEGAYDTRRCHAAIISRQATLDLHRFCSGQVLMLSGPLFEGHG